MSRKGVTLVEVIIVLALIGILSVPGVIGVYVIRTRDALNTSTQSFVSALKRARIFAREGKDLKAWGLRSDGNKVYQLVSFDSGGETVESEYRLEEPTIFQSGDFDIKFEQGLGSTDENETIVLRADTVSTSVRVSKTGVIDEL